MEIKNYNAPVYKKTPNQVQFLTSSLLSSNFIFSSLPQSHSRLLINAMELTHFSEGDRIIAQGDKESKYFYLVDEGTVTFSVDGKPVGQCTRGGGFGELALLYDCARAADCDVTSEKASVWRVDRDTFQICLFKFREEVTTCSLQVCGSRVCVCLFVCVLVLPYLLTNLITYSLTHTRYSLFRPHL